MTPITPMEAYATTDGKLHHDPLDAQAHQHGLDLEQEIETFIRTDPFCRMNGWQDKVTITNWEVSRKLQQLKEQNV
jgi:hypothetical protein